MTQKLLSMEPRLSSRLQVDAAQYFELVPPAAPRPGSAAPSPRETALSRPQSARTLGDTLPLASSRPAVAGRGKPQPELLQKLLFFVRHELQNLHTPPGSDQHVLERLDVFRRAFGHFISSYGAYAPLLLAIQQAYEDAVARSEDRASGLDRMHERLELMRGEAAQLLQARHEQLRQQSDAMTDAMSEREKKMSGTERELRRAQLELGTARTELKRAQRLCSDAEARCADLVSQLEHWQTEASDARKLAGEEVEVAKALQDKLQQHVAREIAAAHEDQERAQQLTELRAELSALRESSVDRKLLTAVQEQLRLAKDKHHKSQAEAKERERVLKGGESRDAFPDGLDWAAEELDGVAFLDQGWMGKRVGEVVSSLVTDLLELKEQLAASRAREAETAALLVAAGVPLGAPALGDEPGKGGGAARGASFLEAGGPTQARWGGFSGVVRRRPELWPRDETSSYVRRLTQKRAQMEKAAGAPPPYADVFRKVASAALEGATAAGGGGGGGGHEGLLCAMALNFEAALEALEESEPALHLFLHVYRGRFSSDVYSEMEKEAKALHRSLAVLSEREGAKGTLSLALLEERMETLLPCKSHAACEELLGALRREAGSADAVPLKTFEARPITFDAAEEPPRGFRLCLQRQFVAEVIALQQDLRAALERALPDDGGPVEEREVLPSFARKALWRVDSATPPHVLTGLLRRAFGAAVTDDEVMDGLPLREFMGKLYRGPVRRYSPRADGAMCDAIEEAVREAAAADKKGKKGKGAGKAKKGKAAEVKPEGVGTAAVRDAVMRADPKRPAAEADWLVKAAMAAAQPASAGGEAPSEVPVPLEAFCQQLRGCLVQPTKLEES